MIKYINLVLSTLFVVSPAYSAGKGLPQLDFTTYPSLIFWSIIALLSLIPIDFLIKSNFIHLGTIIVLLGLIFYLKLSFRIFLGMFFVSFYVLWDVYFWHQIIGQNNLLIISLTMFFLAWILQFIGHKIEGKKPSFIKDIQFLLIGPAWLLGFVYKKIGIKF